MIPAIRFASVERAAKPTIAATSAPEASRLPATRPRPSNCDSAASVPTRISISDTRRRTKRSRVSACWVMPPRSTRPATRDARAENQRSKTRASTMKNAKMAAARIHGCPVHQSSSLAAMPPQPRCLLLDAMGTLLTFEPPAPHLRASLRAAAGVDVGEQAAREAIRAEIAYYRAHLHEGGDAAGLAALRRASAEAMRPALPEPAASLPGEALTDALLTSLRFHAYPEVPATLRELHRRGIRLVAVSNWDVSLHDRLAETGLAPLLDGAVASAELGAAKPEPAAFAHALELAGAGPGEAWHVGDSPREDVDGARAAGLTPVLVPRDGTRPPGVLAVSALDEVPLLFEAP